MLAPVGVLAATGQLVNITDPADSGRKARVTQVGALQVETRPGVVTNATNISHVDVQFDGRRSWCRSRPPARSPAWR